MRQAIVKYNNLRAGILKELDSGEYEFTYDELYAQTCPTLFITFPQDSTVLYFDNCLKNSVLFSFSGFDTANKQNLL